MLAVWSPRSEAAHPLVASDLQIRVLDAAPRDAFRAAPAATARPGRAAQISGLPPDPAAGKPTPTPTEASPTPTDATPPALPDTAPERFFPAAELSTRPHPLADIHPDVREAILLTEAGSVRLTLWIDATGRVLSYEAIPDHMPLEYATAIGEYFASIPFSPGRRDGVAVRSLLRLEVRTAGPEPDAPRGASGREAPEPP